jgi:hypothetical protein
MLILTAAAASAQQSRSIHLADGPRGTLTEAPGSDSATLTFAQGPAITLRRTAPDTYSTLTAPMTVFHLSEDGLLAIVSMNGSGGANSGPTSMQGPRHYARGEYRLVKNGADVRLFLGNSPNPISLTQSAPNMYISATGVIYNEVSAGGGLYEMSMGPSYSPDIEARIEREREAKRRAMEEALDHPVGGRPDPVPTVQRLATSVSSSYPVTAVRPNQRGSRLGAVIRFNGREIAMWGLSDQDGFPQLDPYRNPRYYFAQQELGPNNTPREDTGVYEVVQSADGWVVNKYNSFPIAPEPRPVQPTIQRDGFGRPYPKPE